MRIFDISQPFVFARDRQKFGGKAVKKGDQVPAGFSRAKLEQFYNAGIITVQSQLPTDPPPKRPPPPSLEPQTQLPTDPPPVRPLGDATPAELHHTGAGWYNINVEGLGAVNPDKLKGREAAEQWAADNNYSLPVDGA